VPDGATACSHCGAALTQGRPEPQEQIPAQSQPQTAQAAPSDPEPGAAAAAPGVDTSGLSYPPPAGYETASAADPTAGPAASATSDPAASPTPGPGASPASGAAAADPTAGTGAEAFGSSGPSYTPPPTYSPPPTYQAPPVFAAPPDGAPAPIPLFRPALVGRADLLAVLRDAIAPLVIALLATFGVVVGLAWLASPTGHGGFRDWFTSTVILVAGALGAPTDLNVGGTPVSDSSLGGSIFGSFALNLSLTISLTVWTITLLLFFLWMRRGRRSEAAAPSASPLQLVARSALPALSVSVVLLVLALVSNASDVFNLVGRLNGSVGGGLTQQPGGTDPFGGGGTDPFGGSGGGSGTGGSGAALTLGTASDATNGLHSSIGVSPGWVFLGPLLIAFAAFLIGRLTTVARRPVGDPGGEWIRKLIGPWRGSARIVWTQLRAVGLLAGLVVLVYAEYELLTADGSSGRAKAAQAIAAVLLLPNLMIGGALSGFCVSLSDGVTPGLTGARADEIGLFGNSRPWLIYLLILAALIGSALPWFLVRTRRRVVNPAAFAPVQAWRAALLGAIAGLVVTLLGELSMSGSSGLGSLGIPTEAGLTYSVFGAVIAGALWCTAAYLALAFLVTPRGPREAAQIPQPGGSSYVHNWPGAQPQPQAAPQATPQFQGATQATPQTQGAPQPEAAPRPQAATAQPEAQPSGPAVAPPTASAAEGPSPE